MDLIKVRVDSFLGLKGKFPNVKDELINDHLDCQFDLFENEPELVLTDAFIDNISGIFNPENSSNYLHFGDAVEALKQGKLISREGWNGKGMFVMKQIPAEISLEIIPKMQSVQQSAKDKLIKAGTSLKYENQMLIIKSDGTADSWVPSSSDVFAEDWIILE